MGLEFNQDRIDVIERFVRVRHRWAQQCLTGLQFGNLGAPIGQGVLDPPQLVESDVHDGIGFGLVTLKGKSKKTRFQHPIGMVF